MIALMKGTATDEQLAQFVGWVEHRGLKAHVSQGDKVTIVGLVGDTTRIDPFLLESMDIIERVQRVSEPFKLASRQFHPTDTTVDCGRGTEVGGGNFHVIADLERTGETDLTGLARHAKLAGATLLKGDVYQSRESPHASTAIDPAKLDRILCAGAELALPVVVEAIDARDVATLLEKGVDVLQVGTHNTQNYNLLHEVGMASAPVLLEGGAANTVEELLMAAERVMGGGNQDVMLCVGGTRSFEPRTRLGFDVNTVSVLRHLTHLPVIVDASHAAGYARYVAPAACAAVAAHADGLLVRLRDGLGAAVSDGTQPLAPTQFDALMRRVSLIRQALAQAPEGEE